MVIRIFNPAGERSIVEVEQNITVRELLEQEGHHGFDAKNQDDEDVNLDLDIDEIQTGDITNLYLYKKGDKIKSGK